MILSIQMASGGGSYSLECCKNVFEQVKTEISCNEQEDEGRGAAADVAGNSLSLMIDLQFLQKKIGCDCDMS